MLCFVDAFGEMGRPGSHDEGAVPPNATLLITLELVSWKAVSDITKDKKVLKKILKEGEGYERPNDGAVVQGIIAGNKHYIYVSSSSLVCLYCLPFLMFLSSFSETNRQAT